jgi:hypothetical protein
VVKPKLYILQINKLPAGKRSSSQDETGSYEEIWAEWNWNKSYGWVVDLMKNHLFV